MVTIVPGCFRQRIEVVESLELNLDEYQNENTLQPIKAFRTGLIGRKLVEVKYDQPVSYGILRREFDDYLLRRSGADFVQEAISQIERRGDVWHINEKYSAPLLIGAGGHFCPVARHARNAVSSNQSKGVESIVVCAQEAEFHVSIRTEDATHLDSEIPELYFCRDLQGYGWKFCKGEYINIGLGRIEKKDLSQHVRQFCETLGICDSSWMDSPPKYLGHAYRLYAEQQPFLFDDGLLLIGDAAGLAYPQSGEGIRPAIEFALIAADVIAAADGNYDSDLLSEYATRLVEHLGRVQSIRQHSWLPMSWLRTIAIPLFTSRTFSKKVIVENWFLNRHQPAFKRTRSLSSAAQTEKNGAFQTSAQN